MISRTGKQGQESLSPRVDDINFVQGYRVDDLFAHLQLPLGALDKLGLNIGTA